MAFKFPFTNYHELNLTWVLEQLKKLFEESEENVQTIETYDDRLSAVETEVTDLESTTTQAINTANAAATNAATALSRANTANENALSAGSQAGAAVTAAQGALQEAQAATQAAQQAQATAMTFDGRITQAQNDASAAVQEAQSFENRVNAAINTANNAANTATIAQGIAVNANQTAAQALDELNAQRAELVEISEEQQEAIEEKGQQVIASIPSDYTQLSADVKNKAPLIVANASGDVASFKDGADDMEIRHLIATINPIQAGTGEPSPSNARQLSGRTGLTGARSGQNLLFSYSATGSYNMNAYVIDDSGGGVRFSGVPSWGNTLAAFRIAYAPEVKSKFYNVANVKVFCNSPYCTVTTAYFGTNDNSIIVNANTVATSNSINVDFYIMVYIGDEPSQFAPYHGQSISVNWQTEAGVIYGAELDVITGELTVTHAIIDLASLTWQSASPSVPRCYTNGLSSVIKRPLSNNDPLGATAEQFRVVSRNNAITIDMSISCEYNTGNLFVNGTYTPSGKFVYPIVNTQSYQLDSATVKTLLGYNNIFTDCGPVAVDYPADTKLYIDGKFTELQALVLEH